MTPPRARPPPVSARYAKTGISALVLRHAQDLGDRGQARTCLRAAVVAQRRHAGRGRVAADLGGVGTRHDERAHRVVDDQQLVDGGAAAVARAAAGSAAGAGVAQDVRRGWYSIGSSMVMMLRSPVASRRSAA